VTRVQKHPLPRQRQRKWAPSPADSATPSPRGLQVLPIGTATDRVSRHRRRRFLRDGRITRPIDPSTGRRERSGRRAGATPTGVICQWPHARGRVLSRSDCFRRGRSFGDEGLLGVGQRPRALGRERHFSARRRLVDAVGEFRVLSSGAFSFAPGHRQQPRGRETIAWPRLSDTADAISVFASRVPLHPLAKALRGVIGHRGEHRCAIVMGSGAR
jgi:hypothetical protein